MWVPFHEYSIITFIYTLLLPDREAGGEPCKKNNVLSEIKG